MRSVYHVATKSKAIGCYRQITLDGIGNVSRKKLQSFYLQNVQAVHTTVWGATSVLPSKICQLFINLQFSTKIKHMYFVEQHGKIDAALVFVPEKVQIPRSSSIERSSHLKRWCLFYVCSLKYQPYYLLLATSQQFCFSKENPDRFFDI